MKTSSFIRLWIVSAEIVSSLKRVGKTGRANALLRITIDDHEKKHRFTIKITPSKLQTVHDTIDYLTRLIIRLQEVREDIAKL